jgi:hypothetical protein
MTQNKFPVWGGNKWTLSMFKKYWCVVCFIVVAYILVVFTNINSI